ncbi:type II toxin-antitoxin system RelE/ParE family toxin [Neorhizobium alkalisoli]|uniref:Plasmid stabilization system protein ParE n=1 Tax=Neorhizobium alkalisoli TaxID=528178 RepID=A0A561R340_9HYPH|nr:type II toxin-antitoxin system RelE/ParE family toxin [Neorhizobium alkalisoli]TWF57009.1 plasmid stabilization system protein ParE [Neorhizobium alkalisoli]
MRIRLSKNAGKFLKNEQRYLEHFNPRAAENVMRQLWKSLHHLAEYPQAGSDDPALPGRRHFVSGDYHIRYRVDGRFLAVSHIHHGRQLPPDLEKDEDLPADK